MFMKSKKLIALLLLVVMVASVITPTTAFAADTSPYGYTYDDAATYRTVYKYYRYDSTKKTYVLDSEFYSKGSYLYKSNGTLITNSSNGAGAKYQCFDTTGNFYYISKDSNLLKIDKLGKVIILNMKNCKKFNYNNDDLGVSVSTSSGNFYLSNLAPAPEVDSNDDDYVHVEPVAKPKNRVEIYSNSAGELVYDGYCNSSLKTRIIISSNGKSVLNATDKVRLTDRLKGAKFVGFDSSYNVYLNEGKTLYRFISGKWYSAQKMSLNGTYKSFKKDSNGFISKIVTSNGSYTINQLTTSNKWKASKTYAVSKGSYATLYTKGSSSTHTLELKSRSLYLDGKKIATNVVKFGFINSKKIAFIKTNKKVYTSSLSKASSSKQVYSGGKTFKTTSLGLTTKVVTTKGTKKLS